MNFEKLQRFMDDLHKENITIAFAESMTAGLLVNEFSKANGASKVLKGCIVTYHPELKIRLLNVDPTTIAKFTPESQEVTTEMVKGLLKVISAEIAVAVTGLASEGGSESDEKPVGTVFISVLFHNKLSEFKTVFDSDGNNSVEERQKEIMHKTVDFIFEKLNDLFYKKIK
jgi:nicotinamide-nucleotide amidase